MSRSIKELRSQQLAPKSEQRQINKQKRSAANTNVGQNRAPEKRKLPAANERPSKRVRFAEKEKVFKFEPSITRSRTRTETAAETTSRTVRIAVRKQADK